MSTALVPLTPIAGPARAGYTGGRPQAEFLTQLIATKGQAPQTRARRRAEPEEAIAAYAGTDRRPLAAGAGAVARALKLV